MSTALIVNSLSLLVATVNIFLMIKIFSRITPIAEAPRAWSLLAFGMAMIVIHLSLNMFIWIEPVFRNQAVHYVSAGMAVSGFVGLFAGARKVYQVIDV